MDTPIIVSGGRVAGLQDWLARLGLPELPRLVEQSGPEAAKTFLEYFLNTIRNENTRQAYTHDVFVCASQCGHRDASEGLPSGTEKADGVSFA